MHKPLFAALGALALAAIMAGCAAQSTPAPGPERTVWQMTPTAASSYYYLALEDARRGGRDDEALTAMEQLLELAPSPLIYIEAANYYWRLGRMDKARTTLKRGEELYPTSRDMAVTLANTYYSEKRHEDAITTIKTYLQRVPDDTTAYIDLALIYLDDKHHAEALDALEQIPEDKRDAPVLYYWAKASSGLGLNRQAIAKLKQAVEMDPEFIEAWAELAYLYEVDKDYLAAEGIYTRLVEMGENASEIWLRLINLNIKLNNPDKALSLYRQGPRDIDFALEAATLFLDEKFYDQARAILSPLPTDGDVPPKIWFYLAVLAYEGDQNSETALEYLSKIPAANQHYHRAVRFRIHLLMDNGRFAEAQELILHQQKANPDQSEYWLLESSLAQRQKDLPGARTVLERALVRWPKDTDLLYSLGIVLDKMDLRDEGLATMERIITMDPEHADALNYVGYVLADESRDLERAMVLISRALEREPDSGYIIDSLAWLYFRRGESARAWEEIRRAVERVADDPIVWEHYGDIAAALGKTAKAKEGYRNSLELNPDNKSARAKLEKL
ncbi:tetratricopeptide repeat protein [Desulfovibrio ferrophilus]|uniref:Tetratricopeptide TPR_2 repeat protein n=1 Tax=Desulfovibrio ferrophilus TaxID=241368 RepID=A0A2Z6AXA6_9BACT|nr:tetratricopeptide repeat protein [Desulfovibrio ferrophilus]BBD07871.1 tetratricopeptide TPR_2 repeat protein [Desulfovibrio ferrophilus]